MKKQIFLYLACLFFIIPAHAQTVVPHRLKKLIENQQWEAISQVIKKLSLAKSNEYKAMNIAIIDEIIKSQNNPPDKFYIKLATESFCLRDIIINQYLHSEKGKNNNNVLIGILSDKKIYNFSTLFKLFTQSNEKNLLPSLRYTAAIIPLDELESFTKHILPLSSYRDDFELIWIITSRANTKTLRRLSRYVFPKIDLEPIHFQVLKKANTITEVSQRRKFLQNAKDLIEEKNWEKLLALINSVKEVDIPEGYSLEKEAVGVGKTGRVHQLKDSNGELWAWKVPVNDSADIQKSFKKQIELSEEWRKNGLSSVNVKWSTDKKSLLMNFIEGTRLREAILDEKILDTKNNPKKLALEKFFIKASEKYIYVSGLNPDNLIFDGKEWQIVDSGPIRTFFSKHRTLNEYSNKLKTKWLREELKSKKKEIDLFWKELLDKQNFQNHSKGPKKKRRKKSNELNYENNDIKKEPPFINSSPKKVNIGELKKYEIIQKEKNLKQVIFRFDPGTPSYYELLHLQENRIIVSKIRNSLYFVAIDEPQGVSLRELSNKAAVPIHETIAWTALADFFDHLVHLNLYIHGLTPDSLYFHNGTWSLWYYGHLIPTTTDTETRLLYLDELGNKWAQSLHIKKTFIKEVINGDIEEKCEKNFIGDIK